RPERYCVFPSILGSRCPKATEGRVADPDRRLYGKGRLQLQFDTKGLPGRDCPNPRLGIRRPIAVNARQARTYIGLQVLGQGPINAKARETARSQAPSRGRTTRTPQAQRGRSATYRPLPVAERSSHIAKGANLIRPCLP